MKNPTTTSTVPAADVLPPERNIPETDELAPETRSPNPPKSETVLATAQLGTTAPAVGAPSAIIVAPVKLSHRDALIAKKRKAGLSKDQAERVADDQIAHEQRLIAAAGGRGKQLPLASQPVRRN